MAIEEPDRSLLCPAVLVGISVAGSLDEIVLHHLLRWPGCSCSWWPSAAPSRNRS